MGVEKEIQSEVGLQHKKEQTFERGLRVRFKVGHRSGYVSPQLQNVNSTTSLSSFVGANDQL